MDKRIILTAAFVATFLIAAEPRSCVTTEASVFASAATLCSIEEAAHVAYVAFAPIVKRPADAQAKELERYTIAHNACAAGGTIDQIKAAIDAAQAARAQ